MELSLMPETVCIFVGNWGRSTLFDDTSDNLESIISPRTAMLLVQDLIFRPAPTSFALPAPRSLIAMPADTNLAPFQRPESQEDWKLKKEIIRSLYLDENLPLEKLMSTMSSTYSFSATERMHKRQLLRWNWRRYNTKGRQQSHINGELLETRCGKPTCKRPTRRRVMGLTD
ncbi:Clr5 domain-containing protein [Colletotrichum navitas]|uniref:Clr5 domain-containing protein n=1 Tax=Colletotrichum navitas TaxID=681940 RepID=A0AAD8Q286_9PEZI|nr:Clr5 domain-containing protein [Colletotrichum navitas]KAK1594159.1 Clr5 domain-containing protein [Colletotrichum navitas]